MMESGFDLRLNDDVGERIELGVSGSSRYRFHKARINGRLQFVKSVADEKAPDLINVEALRKEFAIAYPLDHPAIVRYFSFSGTVVFEEFIDGSTLRQLLDSKDEILKSDEFLTRVCRQVLEAVEYLHAQGVLHLDIKPENVMVTRVGSNVKLVDFGCAQSSSCDSTPGYTYNYKAPEQGVSETNCFTDIFLVGKLMAELAENAGQTKKWRRFVAKATADDPADRFQSATEALNDIPGKQNKRLLTALIAAAILFCGIAAFIFSRSEGDDLQPVADDLPPIVTADTTTAANATTDSATVAPGPPQPEPPKQAAAPKPEDPKLKLQRMIDKYIIDYYTLHVIPVAKDTTLQPNGELTQEHDDSLQSAMRLAIQSAMDYGAELGKQYPAQKDFIDNRVMETINSQQTRASFAMYGPPLPMPEQ